MDSFRFSGQLSLRIVRNGKGGGIEGRKLRIGVDLGGTKIEAIVLADDGQEVCRERVATPQGDYQGTVKTIGALVNELTRQSGSPKKTPVGVGIPGTLSPQSGLVKNANSTCLIGRPLDKDLEAELNRPVKLANDADCFTISESTDGAGAGAAIVFGVILGTGVGGGISINGTGISGPNAITGEWGHVPMPWPQTLEGGEDERPGINCYCGLHSCIETYLSGPGMVRDHKRCSGQQLTTYEILSQAESGNRECELTLSRYEHRLARGLANVINILDPNVIVLGGGMSNIERLYRNVPPLWNDWLFSDQCETVLKKNHHGDSSGVRGAAWLWNSD